MVTRAQGLAEAAEFNRKLLVEVDGEVRGEEWAILVEIGRPRKGVSLTWHLFENGMGFERRDTAFPLRLVAPTAAEIKRYGKLPNVKAGVA